MDRSKKTYQICQVLSAVFLIAALLWLTVSLPFVYESQRTLAKLHQATTDQSHPPGCDEEAANSFGNTTEEKAPSTSLNQVSEEYLHDHNSDEYFHSKASQIHKCENSGIYDAFHGEVHVPPPNA